MQRFSDFQDMTMALRKCTRCKNKRPTNDFISLQYIRKEYSTCTTCREGKSHASKSNPSQNLPSQELAQKSIALDDELSLGVSNDITDPTHMPFCRDMHVSDEHGSNHSSDTETEDDQTVSVQ